MTATLYGHRDFVKTSCPGNRYQEWVPQLRSLIEEDEVDITKTLQKIGASPEGSLDAEQRAFREALYLAFEKMARRSERETGKLSAYRGHLENHPAGSAGVSLAEVKDEIDKAKLTAERE